MEKRRQQKKSYRKPPPKKKSALTDLEVAKKMLNIHQSAMDRKLEFDLSFESVRLILLEERCYYTGRVFEDEGIYSRSIDRIDSSKGYVEGNVVACTVDFNGKKSNLSIDEIEILYEKLVKPKRYINPDAEQKPDDEIVE